MVSIQLSISASCQDGGAVEHYSTLEHATFEACDSTFSIGADLLSQITTDPEVNKENYKVWTTDYMCNTGKTQASIIILYNNYDTTLLPHTHACYA